MSSITYVFFTFYLSFQDNNYQQSSIGYGCPKCGAVHCEIPCYCKICNLLLTTSAHIIRAQNAGVNLELFYNAMNASSYKGKAKGSVSEVIWKAILQNGGRAEPGRQKIECKGCKAEIEFSLTKEADLSEGIRGISICPKCACVFCL